MLVTLALAVLAACEPSERACTVAYGDCMDTAECERGATCDALAWAEGEGSICQRPCQSELDCPREGGRTGRCIDVNGTGEFRCHLECAFGETCPTGWVCQPIVSSGVPSAICLP